MSSLSHHGIKGQRWGIRRFQNKDGTLTREGQIRFAKKNLKRAKVRNLDKWGKSPDSNVLYIIGTSGSGKSTTAKGLADDGDQVIHLDTIFEKENHGSPDSNKDFEAFLKENNVDISKASDFSIPREERWQTYDTIGDLVEAYGQHCFSKGSKVVIEGVQMGDQTLYPDKNYFNGKPTVVLKGNIVRDTLRADRRDGVPLVKTIGRLTDKERWNWYKQVNATSNEIKYTSIGGTMYIEGNALILGDSSYLEHHGIRGQRWGVRRFQNRDGSLTNAGRKRLGYATKGATQAVKKAFKAGTKTGAKAVKAVKAHYKKVEEKKIEKKKEKASKTRAGVSANKDLFTAKELKELNSKFEEQDKLTMARIKRGVEVAKAVGETAKSIGEVGKAYEALTGHKLVPDIMTLQNGGSIDFNSKDKDSKDSKDSKDKDTKDANDTKDKDSKDSKDSKDKDTKDKDDGDSPENNGSGDKPKGHGIRGSKWGVRKKESTDDSDLRNQMEAAKKQASKAMKNAKLQEYIDAYNRDQNSEKNKELTARGQKAIEILSKGGGFNSEAPSSSPSPTPKATPSSNNLMAQIRAAQTKLEKPNKNETPAEHKEAQKKLNALEKVANEYKAAANKPGTDSAEVAEKLLKKNKDILDSIKHMDFSDDVYLEHHGVRGMKWGKHLMAGKGSGLYDGTALGGGGGGAMTEEERKKAEELRKKKLEEAKKKAEEATKEKEIERKAKEIGISTKAYKNYSIDKNHLPGKHHYDKSQKLHGEASSSLAETQATERQAHMNRAKAASLMRKVNSSHMFDADGYHISQQRGDDRKEAKQLKKEAKQLDKKSKKALKKFYKKRYKADKERQKWQNSTSGKYHHIMRHYEIQNGVLFLDSSDYLSHHGVKGQKWGVRRFQNEDGTLTDKGRKHYEKAIEKLDRKQVNSDNRRGALERQHPFAVTASAILTGSAYAALMIASAANPATIALGTSIVAAVSALGTHVDYSVAEAWEARGTRHRQKKRKEYEEMLNHDGMYHVENGTLFIGAGEPYLEHHGVKGMKWGKHLMAGKSEAGAGGGGGEDDEKLKEMAKKAGMSVAEYKQKFASKIGGAASKVGEKVYDAAGGSHKKNAEGWRKMAREESNAARASEKSAHENSARAASQDRKYGSGGDVYRRAAESDKENAQTHHSNAKARSERAASEQAAYEKSLAGKYDKMKADHERKTKMKRRKMIEDAFRGSDNKSAKRISVKDRLKSTLGKSKQRKQLSTEGPKAKKQISNARDSVEKASRSNENAYKHAKAVYRQTGSDSDAYKQAIKRSGTTLQRYIDSKKLLAKKKRAKHSDDTNAVYTEGTKLVINSKWG